MNSNIFISLLEGLRLGNATSFQENACFILDNLSETRLLNVGLYLKKIIEK